ncbi:MAG: DUF4249 domain-containing protein [Maribacter sp.]|uniref:DUF4249 domain-containing protein n=1 Tax=Maribacter sp. TaxID=1897614 RepID=UPI003297DFB8
MKKNLVIGFVFCCVVGCIEPFEFETEAFEDALVIQASITNEMKQHHVVLSRAVRFEDTIAAAERSARVRVIDDSQNEFLFEEVQPGNYVSPPFEAQKNVNYTLVVETTDGTTYTSNPESFQAESEVTEVYAERETNAQGEDGISIFINGQDTSGASAYYRYEYEETYKIIAPNWTSVDFKLTNYDPCALPVITYDLEIVPREEEEQVCYQTLRSQEIIQNSSVGLSGSQVERFPVRFIKGDDFILSHRYSILVKQYVQSIDAFSYFQNLDNFSSNSSVFSEIQPGFLDGNISAEANSDKKVLGYFEVASVSEKRLFFNYREFYPDEPLPLYVNKCVLFSTPLEHQSFCAPVRFPTGCPQSLIERIDKDLITYVDANGANIGACPGPYIVVPRECGDCTALGTNVVPAFWEE